MAASTVVFQVSWHGETPAQMVARIKRELTDIMSQITMFLDGLQESSVESIKNTISTTPSAIVAGKKDRIWHGQMISSVSAKVDRSKTSVKMSAGWVGNFENYFLIQDQGGYENTFARGWIYITPMHALMTAYMEGTAAMVAEMKSLGGKVL